MFTKGNYEMPSIHNFVLKAFSQLTKINVHPRTSEWVPLITHTWSVANHFATYKTISPYMHQDCVSILQICRVYVFLTQYMKKKKYHFCSTFIQATKRHISENDISPMWMYHQTLHKYHRMNALAKCMCSKFLLRCTMWTSL